MADDGGESGDREDAGVRSCAAETAIVAAEREFNRNYLLYCGGDGSFMADGGGSRLSSILLWPGF